MHLLHPSFFILRHRKVGPFKISGVVPPNRMNTVESTQHFRGTPVSLPRLFASEKSGTWLHIPDLMNDYDRQHTPSRCVFFARYLFKQRKSMAKYPAMINRQSAIMSGFTSTALTEVRTLRPFSTPGLA